MTQKAARSPAGLKASGRALWRAVVADYDLDEHEVTILKEACRTADLCDRLEALLADELMTETSQGPRVHPAAAELRQQRVTLARLIVALRIPADTSDGRTQTRPIRGVYGIAGGAS